MHPTSMVERFQSKSCPSESRKCLDLIYLTITEVPCSKRQKQMTPDLTSTMICFRMALNRTQTTLSAFGGGQIVLLILTSAQGLGAKSLIELSLNCENIAYGQFSVLRSISTKHQPEHTTLVYDLCMRYMISCSLPIVILFFCRHANYRLSRRIKPFISNGIRRIYWLINFSRHQILTVQSRLKVIN